MRFVYRCIESNCHEEEIGDYITYGILVTDDEGNILKTVEDISLDEMKIKKLADLLNKSDVSITHFDDIIEDFLVDFEC